jgi:hypothetical protein
VVGFEHTLELNLIQHPRCLINRHFSAAIRKVGRVFRNPPFGTLARCMVVDTLPVL